MAKAAVKKQPKAKRVAKVAPKKTATKTAAKKTTANVKVKDLPIVKQAKHYTNKFSLNPAFEYVYYDGKTLTATDSCLAIQVDQVLPKYEAGTVFTPAGRKVDKELNYPLERLNGMFATREKDKAAATITLSSEELKEWVNMLKFFDEMLSKYHFGLKKRHNGDPVPNSKTTTLRVSQKELTLSTNQIYDEHSGYHTMKYTPSGKVKINNRQNPLVIKHYSAGYLYRALKVLQESGADIIELHLFDQMLFIKSPVGRSIIMGIRIN